MSNPNDFLSEKNEAKLQRVLYTDICRRVGGELNERQAVRLMKTVKHYMGEIHRVQGNRSSIVDMNKEVLAVTLPDYLRYLDRQSKSSSRSVLSDMDAGPGEQIGQERPQRQLTLTDTIPVQPRAQMDVTNAFNSLQAQRQEGKSKPPPIQDFRISLQDEGTVNMGIFEKIKQEREQEAMRVREQQEIQARRNDVLQQGVVEYANAGDSWQRDRRRAEEEAEAALADRERQRLEARASAGNQFSSSSPSPIPDMRQLFMGDRQQISRTQPFVPPNTSAGNPTTALSMEGRETSSQQLIITREPSVMNYKETELNLFVYSADRDWVSNSTETRYNFSVNFDPANMPTGLRLSPTSTVKFKNISRIELVKAIMPGESIDSLVTRTYSGSAFSYSSPYNINILSFPYIQVRIPELDNNIYGTNQGLNASFGVLQYDANWIYDTNNSNQRGYFAMIPKFLKCQKVYSPTPLSTLNKLSFRFERPDGTLISDVPDTLAINHIYSSKEKTVSTGVPYGYDATVENGTGSAYYFIQTTTYFNQLTVTKGDRIQIKNVNWTTAATGTTATQVQDFLDYIQDDAGLIVVDVGYGANVGAVTIGANSQGYCNFLIVRGKFTDPTLGTTVTATLGNVADPSTPGSLSVITDYLSDNDCSTGRLINLSHQVQVSLRVIVREVDSTGLLRPDNI